MAEVWPSTLPKRFLPEDYTETEPDNLLRSQTETGPAKVRVRSSSAVRLISGSMWLPDDQRATFKTFYNTTLIHGSLAFTYPNPDGGSDLLVRITEPPNWAKVALGRWWRLSVKLEVLP